MKKYIVPQTDCVILNIGGVLVDGNPHGSYTVEELEKDPEVTIGGDDVNSFNISLWDEEE